jgi:hypothetical protein
MEIGANAAFVSLGWNWCSSTLVLRSLVSQHWHYLPLKKSRLSCTRWWSHAVACGGCGPHKLFNFIRKVLKMALISLSLKKKKKITLKRGLLALLKKPVSFLYLITLKLFIKLLVTVFFSSIE